MSVDTSGLIIDILSYEDAEYCGDQWRRIEFRIYNLPNYEDKDGVSQPVSDDDCDAFYDTTEPGHVAMESHSSSCPANLTDPEDIFLWLDQTGALGGAVESIHGYLRGPVGPDDIIGTESEPGGGVSISSILFLFFLSFMSIVTFQFMPMFMVGSAVFMARPRKAKRHRLARRVMLGILSRFKRRVFDTDLDRAKRMMSADEKWYYTKGWINLKRNVHNNRTLIAIIVAASIITAWCSAGAMIVAIPGTAYSLSTDRTFSNIDGLETDFNPATDTVSATNAYRLTADINVSGAPAGAGTMITLSDGGEFVVNAGITMTIGNVYSGSYLSYSHRIICDGSSGAISWTAPNPSSGTYMLLQGAGGYTYFDNVTCTASGANNIYDASNSGNHIILNSTFTGQSNGYQLVGLGGGGTVWIENSTFSDSKTGTAPAGAGTALNSAKDVTVIDSTFTVSSSSGTFFGSGASSSRTYAKIAGNVTWRGTTFNPTSPTTQWLPANVDQANVECYSKITTTVTGGVNPLVSVGKAGSTNNGKLLHRKTTSGYTDGRTASTINYTYVLCHSCQHNAETTNYDTITTYYSDQNQTETGNNSQYTVNCTSASGSWYSTAQTTWGITTGNTYATGVSIAITMSEHTTTNYVKKIDSFPSDGTSDKTTFTYGDTVYFGNTTTGGVTLSGTTTATVTCTVYNISDVAQGSAILSASGVSFTADVEKTFYSMNSNVLIQKASLSAGDYYLKTVVSSGATAETRVYFTVAAVPIAVGTVTVSDTSITESESVTISTTITGTPTHATAYIGTAGFVMSNTTGTTWSSGAVRGSDIGIGAAYTVYVVAAKDGEGDTNTSASTVTVTAAGTGLEEFLDQTVTIEPFDSYNDYGRATYGTSFTTAAKVVLKSVQVVTTQGDLVTSTTQTFLPPATTITAKDRITLPDATQPKIKNVETLYDPTQTAQLVVVYT